MDERVVLAEEQRVARCVEYMRKKVEEYEVGSEEKRKQEERAKIEKFLAEEKRRTQVYEWEAREKNRQLLEGMKKRAEEGLRKAEEKRLERQKQLLEDMMNVQSRI
jgi:hypothetical protein